MTLWVKICKNRLDGHLDLLKLCPQACQNISLLKLILSTIIYYYDLLCASSRVHASMTVHASSLLSLRAAALPDLGKQCAQAGSHRYGPSGEFPPAHLHTEKKHVRSPDNIRQSQTEIPGVSNKYRVMVYNIYIYICNAKK